MKELIARIICSALNNVFTGQPNLSKFIPQETAEREPNLSFHFANELWKYLFWLDCDFDVTKSFHEDKRPDMVFHKRGINALNFLVVEVKRKSNPLGFSADLEKIQNHWFGVDLHYQFGASVVIDEKTGDYELRLLERDRRDEVTLVKKSSFNSPLNLSDLCFNARKMLNTKVDGVVGTEKAKADTTALVEDFNKWVGSAYGRKWNIDDIVIGSKAKQWLTERQLLPSTWGFQEGQEKSLEKTGIRLTIMYSPASVLKLQPNPLKDVDAARLVIVDANAFDNPKLTREEKIATMLHEIGHVFHELAPKKSIIDALKTGQYVAEMNSVSESENAADDYACQIGYGNHIASGLEKLAEIYPDKFSTDEVKARIKRMKERTA
jgi:hypothetical protein